MNPLIHRNDDEELAFLEEQVEQARRLVARSEMRVEDLIATIEDFERRKQQIFAKRKEPLI